MAMMLSIDEAKDVIDKYGPDATFWPAAEKAELNRLVANDVDFREYVEDARWLEDMLDGWTEGMDGVEIELDDADFDPAGAGGAGEGPRADHDDEEGDDDFQPSDLRDDEDEDDGEDHARGDTGISFGNGAGQRGDLPTEETESSPPPIVIDLSQVDPDDLKDMDDMLTDFIRRQMEAQDATEFRVFTRDFDEIVDIKVPENVSLEQIEQKVAGSTGPLQKDLRRMIASRSQVKRVPGRRSGRLHAPNLHRILAGDDRVFTRREEAASLDTAISLLIDASGSMSGARTVLATEAAYAIGSVLSKIGIAFECLGFTDNIEDKRITDKDYQKALAESDAILPIHRAIPLTMPKFKTFDERWNTNVQRRFAHVHNMDGYSHNCGYEMGSTPEGCGLEFAARRLLQRKEKRKILISMTDGSPGGHLYNYSTGFGVYQQQSVDVVKSIEAAGIDLVGVGIQHNGPAGYYTNHMQINAIDEMPKQLLALLKRFIVG